MTRPAGLERFKNGLGHSPPVITQALVDQSRKRISPSPAFYNEPSMRLAQRHTIIKIIRTT